MNIIKFFSASDIEKLLEGHKQKLLRKISSEIALFLLIITIIITSCSIMEISNFILIYLLLLPTFILNLFISESSTTKISIQVNKYLKKFFFGKDLYKYVVSVIHLIVVIFLFTIFLMGITYMAESYYNTGKSVIADVIFVACKSNNIYYLGFLVTFIIFYIPFRMTLSPTLKVLNSDTVSKYKVDIKLIDREKPFNDMYILNVIDNNLIYISNKAYYTTASESYVINKDNIEYIKIHSNNDISSVIKL